MKILLKIVSAMLLAVFILSAFAYFVFLIRYLLLPSDWKNEITQAILVNGTYTLGIPFAALGAFTLVVALPLATNDPLKFQIPGVTVSGTSSQILFWIVSFLTIVTAIRLLAPLPPDFSKRHKSEEAVNAVGKSQG